ncbi:leukocyte immunoglobulin-like receptor subfamily B member 2 isoform X3 [Choloepus didactylus]|uniref:leukocyte immunoglobulin-like receptor subfamily B member 2 isoform X3 n=1 Tax=Choloepus didactylus TaxID=27675 RepID=UPI0018A067AA|nr:leukocyte immunoglobulin-like receptor subfamily B member 2 isoform X3 [Choloepus didactylus]
MLSTLAALLSTLAALLCLGLCLDQRSGTQRQTLLKPTIWAKPSSVTPKGTSVTIWCQGTHEADEFFLYFEGGLSASERWKPPGSMNKVKFPVLTMTLRSAGQYVCLYQSGGLSSEPSDPLDLIMTDRDRNEHVLSAQGGTVQPPAAEIRGQPGRVPHGPCDPSPQRDVQVLRLLQQLRMVFPQRARETAGRGRNWGHCCGAHPFPWRYLGLGPSNHRDRIPERPCPLGPHGAEPRADRPGRPRPRGRRVAPGGSLAQQEEVPRGNLQGRKLGMGKVQSTKALQQMTRRPDP